MPGGVLLFVRATPRANLSMVAGVSQDADGRPVLQLRIAAPPVDGAANAELIALISTALQVRKRDVTVQSGATGRAKQLVVQGDSVRLIARLENLIRDDAARSAQ